MSGDTIDSIFEGLERIRKRVAEKDPQGRHWDLRITCAWRIFRAFDVPRFRLEPADLQKVLADLLELQDYIEQSAGVNGNSLPLHGSGTLQNPPQDASKTMWSLYGLAWAALSREQYYEATELLASRLRNSNMDVSFIKGAECLDLGTGIARYALSMIQLGARHVIGVDFSLECLDEARRRLEGSKESQYIELIHDDLYKLPKEMDDAFDFVCANGVIHHLPDPVKGLEVVFRCTRKGGRAFVFVFSKSDSPWWPSIELMRELAAPVPIQYAHSILKFYEVPGTKLFNTLDYSYTPIQHKFDREWFEETLRNIGFREIQLLKGGVIHDSVLRCNLFNTDSQLYGITEIRYLLRK